MSSIVTGILSSTVGLLWNNAQDAIAKRLKDGDITDAKLREIVVRELNDVKTKIDGLSRKDLLSSYSFLQEGVQLLIVSLDKSKDEQKAVQSAKLKIIAVKRLECRAVTNQQISSTKPWNFLTSWES
jgi:hypothetical protein